MKAIMCLLAMLVCASFGSERRPLSISGGDQGNRLDDPSYPIGANPRPSYVVTKYQFSGGKEKWVGLFCNSLVDAVKDDPEAYAYAKTARSLSITSTAVFVVFVPLLFPGISELNSSSETESGKHDISKASPMAFILTGSAIGGFIASGILFAIGKHKINKVAKAWNRNLSLGIEMPNPNDGISGEWAKANLQFRF